MAGEWARPRRCGALRSGLLRSRRGTEAAPSCRAGPSLTRRPVGRGPPARHPGVGPCAPAAGLGRPRHGGGEGSSLCSEPVWPHPLLGAPKGQETVVVACLIPSSVSPGGEHQTLDKGVHRCCARPWDGSTTAQGWQQLAHPRRAAGSQGGGPGSPCLQSATLRFP